MDFELVLNVIIEIIDLNDNDVKMPQSPPLVFVKSIQ